MGKAGRGQGERGRGRGDKGGWGRVVGDEFHKPSTLNSITPFLLEEWHSRGPGIGTLRMSQ